MCMGDSQVLFHSLSGSSAGELATGQIESIFVHRRFGEYRDQVFASISRFSDLSEDDQKFDPYRRFKHIRFKLVYCQPSTVIEVVPIQDLFAHFASCV
jgi:hypothetical protein